MYRAFRTRRNLTLGLAIGVATVIKTWLALTTYGTNDVKYWQVFMDEIVARSSVQIYRDIPYYNHPPMVSGALWLLHFITAGAPKALPFLARLPSILADIASVLLMYRLVRFAWDERRAVVCAVGVAGSPILVLVSGFHGNSDPVFTALILLAAERLLIGKSPIASGLVLGLACNVKLVPLLMTPVFFFHVRPWPRRARFAAAVVAVLLIGYGYHTLAAWPFIKRNAFDYSGLKGIWGLTLFLKGGLPSITSPGWVNFLKYLIGLIVVVRAIGAARLAPSVTDPAEHARMLLRQIGEGFFVFFLLTPGFGIQYLTWFAVTSYLMSPAGAATYNVLGGLFMFSVYHFWNRGFPWDYANSDKVGPWGAPQALFGQLTWLALIIWLALIVEARVRAARLRRQVDVG